MQKPNNDKAEILKFAISKGGVSMKDFGWIQGFRTRISELRELFPNLFLPAIKANDKNRRKQTFTYHYHALNLSKEKAIKIYNQINRHD